MEFLLYILGLLLFFALLGEACNAINWVRFLCFLVVGSVILAILFSFTAEGVFVVIGAYLVLIVISVFFGAFKNVSK